MIPEVIHGTPVRAMARVQIAAAVFAAHITINADADVDEQTIQSTARASWRLADMMLNEELRAHKTDKEIEDEEVNKEGAK